MKPARKVLLSKIKMEEESRSVSAGDGSNLWSNWYDTYQVEDSGFESDWSASEIYHLFLCAAFLKLYFMLPLSLGAPRNFSGTPPSICDEEW